MVRETCEALLAAGVPLRHFAVFVYTLHPSLRGIAFRWDRATGKVTSHPRGHETETSDEVLNSPVQAIYDGAAALRRRLERPGYVADFPVLERYARDGATDYVIMQLQFTGGGRHCISLTTDRPGGFSLSELRLVDALLPYLARLTEIQANRYLAKTLLDTYVGADAGEAILTGNIRRGSAETIHAVIWMCDLRGYTELSETLPRDELIALLNEYFDCVGPPVRERGGEILKFVGDAMLAIFRIDDTETERSACSQAADAVGDARERLTLLNERRGAAGKPPIRCGIALHLGDVSYGNIGTADRLDFTVIGPAVNMAARLTSLCRELNETALLSGAVARTSPLQVEALGRHALKGIAEPQEIFRLLGTGGAAPCNEPGSRVS